MAINNTNDNVLVSGTSGKDNITNTGSYVTIDGGDGNDTISNSGSNVTIKSSYGNDVVSLLGSKQLIYESYRDEGDMIYGFASGDNTLVSYRFQNPVMPNTSNVFQVSGENVYINGTTFVNAVRQKLNITSSEYGNPKTYLFTRLTETEVSGSSDVNYVINTAAGVEINANGSAVYNSGSLSKINGNSGNDSIRNDGDRTQVYGGAGNDSIVNHGSVSTVESGDGNDSIINEGNEVTIDAGAGNDVIGSFNNLGVSINGGAGDDTLTGSGSTLRGGAGNDLINLSSQKDRGSNVVEYGNGDGNDSIFGFGTHDTLKLTSGAIGNAVADGTDVVLNIGSGTIRLKNAAGYAVNIMDASGNLTQQTFGNIVLGTEEADTLNNNQNDVIIRPLSGNDVISLSGSRQLIDYSTGYDTIYGLKDGDTIRLDEGVFSSQSINGSDVVYVGEIWEMEGDEDDYTVISGDGLTLKDAADKKYTMISSDGKTIYVPPAGLTLPSGTGIEKIESRWSNVAIKTDDAVDIELHRNDVTVQGGNGALDISAGGVLGASIKNGSGDDQIGMGRVQDINLDLGNGDNNVNIEGEYEVVGTANITIEGGSGSDNIEMGNVVKANVKSGDGNDYVVVSGNRVTLEGGAGNDTLYGWGNKMVIVGGAGNDTVATEGNWIYKYASGDGNDTVLSEGTSVGIIELTSGSLSSTLASGDDLILRIGNGSITIKDFYKADDTTLALKDAQGNLTTLRAAEQAEGTKLNLVSNVQLSDAHTVNNFGDNVSIGATFADYEPIITGNVSNYGDNAVIGGVGNVHNYGDNARISLTAYRNGYPYTEPLNGTIINEGANASILGTAYDTISNIGNNSTITGGDFGDVIRNGGYDVGEGLKVFRSLGAKSLVDGGEGEDSIGNFASDTTVLGGAGDDTILNGQVFRDFDEPDEIDTDTAIVSGARSLLDGGAGNDYIANFSKNVTIKGSAGSDWISLGGANQVLDYREATKSFDTIYGFSATDTLRTKNDRITFEVDGNDVKINGIKFVDAANKKFNLNSSALMFASSQLVEGASDIDSVLNMTDGATINAEGSAVYNLGSEVSIIGSDGNDVINSRAVNVTINGGVGNDSINITGSGNVIEFGAGDGNDTVLGFDENDTLKITSGVGNAVADGVHVVLSVGSDSIRLKNMAGRTLNIEDASGNLTQQTFGNIVSENEDEHTLNNSQNDAIIQLDGDNDSITLSGARQIIDYNGGNYTITGIDNDDTIRIIPYSFYKTSISGNDVIWMDEYPEEDDDGNIIINNGLTLKNAVNKKYTVIESDGKTAYVSSGGMTLPKDSDVENIINVCSGVNIEATNQNRKTIESWYGGYIDNVTIKADGENEITARGTNVSVSVGGGDDTINISGETLRVDAGAGDDYISGMSDEDAPSWEMSATINAGDGDDRIGFNRSANVSVNAGAGDDSIQGRRSTDFTISGGNGDDYISLYRGGTRALVDGGDGNDSLFVDYSDNGHSYAYGNRVTVLGGAGNDVINALRDNANDATIDGGDGNDIITGGDSINGGAGDDSITGGRVVRGGTGNDFVTFDSSDFGSTSIYQYANGDGNDYVILGSHGLIQLLSGSISNTTFNEHNYAITFAIGSGSLTVNNDAGALIVKDASGNLTVNNDARPLIVKDASGNLTAWHIDYDEESGEYSLSNSTMSGGGYNGLANQTLTAILDDPDYGDINSIFNYGRNASIKAEYITNYGDNSTLEGTGSGTGSGDDYNIFNLSADNVLINANKLAAINSGDRATINGSQRVENYGGNVVIKNVADDDADVFNQGSNVTIEGGKSVDNTGERAVILGGEGVANEIFSGGSNSSINAGDADDFVNNYGQNATINGGTGNDLIFNGAIVDHVSDWVHLTSRSAGMKSVVLGGDGNDSIFNYSDNVTLNGGTGNDTIEMSGAFELVQYADGDGNDVVYGYLSNDTLKIDGSYETVESGEDVIITVGEGTITLKDAAGRTALNIIDNSSTQADSLMPGIEYNPKKPSTITVKNPFTGVVDAAKFSDKVTLIDASADSNPVMLKAGAKSTVLRAGSGNSTMVGGAKDDKMYGGEGADVYVYTVGGGKDAAYDVEAQDIVSIVGATRDKITLTDKSNVVTVEFDGDKKSKFTVNKVNADDAVKFNIDGEEFVYGSIPSGAAFNKAKTTLTIEANAALDGNATLNASLIATTIKELDASKFGKAIGLIGNGNANVLRAGTAGSTLDGGLGSDKLYGGDGKDVFVYSVGGGSDVIYKFDGADEDYVVLDGVKSLDSSALKISATKIDVTIGKGKLSFDNPNGEIKFFSADGDSLYSTGVNFPSGVGYNAKKTAVTIGSSAADVGTIDLGDPKYISTVKEINATAYGGSLNLIGNANANVLHAGTGDATLDGGCDKTKKKATSDKLYGSTVGADVFVWDASLGGGDQIYNYDYSKGDIVSLTGSATIDNSNFKASGKNVVLTIGKNKLTINDVKDKPIVVVNGTDTLSFNSLPGGIAYNDLTRKTALNIADPYTGTVDVADYATSVVTLNAASDTGSIVLIGNKKTKAIVGGAGETTLIGNSSKDVFYGGAGSDTFLYTVGGGKDVINNFNSDTDVIRISGTTVALTDFAEKSGNVVLTVGNGNITIKDAPRGRINVEYDGGSVSYKVLPEGVSYNAKKSVVTADKTFGGTLIAADLELPVKEINASAATKAVELRAYSNATKLTAGKGGSTLVGGSGNDTLIGGNGSDIFRVGVGNDLIDKYTSGKDKIELTSGSVTEGKVSGSNVELTTSGGKITIKGVVGKVIEVDDVKYKFAKTTKSLAEAASLASASQLPGSAEDYWFMQSDEANDELGTLIIDSTTADDAALGSMQSDFDSTKQLMQLATPSVVDKKRK